MAAGEAENRYRSLCGCGDTTGGAFAPGDQLQVNVGMAMGIVAIGGRVPLFQGRTTLDNMVLILLSLIVTVAMIAVAISMVRPRSSSSTVSGQALPKKGFSIKCAGAEHSARPVR
jgi:hypothetical protein